MCLATDASLIADPGVARVRIRPVPILWWRLIMKLFLLSFSSLPLNHSRRIVVSYKRKYVHEVLVFKTIWSSLPRKKVWKGELTVRAPDKRG